MPLPSQVVLLRKRTLKVLCAFDAVEFAETGPVLFGDERLVLFELAGVAEVGVHLVEVSACGVSFSFVRKGEGGVGWDEVPCSSLGFGLANATHCGEHFLEVIA